MRGLAQLRHTSLLAAPHTGRGTSKGRLVRAMASGDAGDLAESSTPLRTQPNLFWSPWMRFSHLGTLFKHCYCLCRSQQSFHLSVSVGGSQRGSASWHNPSSQGPFRREQHTEGARTTYYCSVLPAFPPLELAEIAAASIFKGTMLLAVSIAQSSLSAAPKPGAAV